MRQTSLVLCTLIQTSATALEFTPAMAAADPSRYLCVVDDAAGLHYERSIAAWRPQTFKPGHKYIFRHLTPDDRDKGKWQSLLKIRSEAGWALFDFGEKDPLPEATCKKDYTFDCQRVTADFNFDDKTLRFEIARHGSYVDQGYWERLRREESDRYDSLQKSKQAIDPDAPDDLVFEIGKCNPL
jgi:hypothetical protein